MWKVLANRTYRHLFLAQVIALVGTGLATVAIGLLAYQIAGKNAGAVLGTALAIKMIAYVVLSPIAGAFAESLPRKKMLVLLDLVRAAVACALPFVSEAWQIYVLIFLLHSASAAFTPAFQATIPEILPDEAQYTRALSLSRLAYDLENLLSPILAALLLTIVSFHALFAGTIIGFLVSALLVVSVTLPKPAPKVRRSFFERTTRGIRSYFATPRLRALFAISLAVSAAGSMVIVNTVVFVQARFGLGQQEVAWAMAAFGGGSMIARCCYRAFLIVSRTGWSCWPARRSCHLAWLERQCCRITRRWSACGWRPALLMRLRRRPPDGCYAARRTPTTGPPCSPPISQFLTAAGC